MVSLSNLVIKDNLEAAFYKASTNSHDAAFILFDLMSFWEEINQIEPL